MKNFEYYAPTKVYFGRGQHERVGEIIAGYGFKKILIHYGGGSIKRSGLYDAESTKRTYAALLERAESVLRAGRPVIVDAAFTKQAQRAPFLALGAQLGVPAPIAHLRCDDATLRQRLEARSAEGKDISDGRLELLDAQRRSFEPPEGALELDAALDVHAAVSRTLAQLL